MASRCGAAALAPPLGELSARTGWLRGCSALVAASQKFYEFRRGRQLGDPSGFAAGGRLRAAPTRCGGNREPTATNVLHPLSFAFAQQLPQRWSQGHFVPAGRQVGDPYKLRNFWQFPFSEPLSFVHFGRLRASRTTAVETAAMPPSSGFCPGLSIKISPQLLTFYLVYGV